MSENGDLKTNLNSINNGENINNESETSEADPGEHPYHRKKCSVIKILASTAIIVVSICIILAVIIIIFVRYESTRPFKPDEIIGAIKCKYYITKPFIETEILSSNYKNISDIDITIDDKRIEFNKKYIFNKEGYHDIIFYLNNNETMDYMFKNTLTPSVRRKSFDLIEKAVSDIQLGDNIAIFVGISGGPSNGKTKLSQYFHKLIEKSEIIKELSFFKINNIEKNIKDEDEYLIKEYENYSKDRRKFLIEKCFPNSFDYDKFYEVLKDLRYGKKVKIPFFDEDKCIFIPEKDKVIDPSKTPLIIIEGYYIFKDSRLKELINLKIYKEVEDDVRLSRLVEKEEKYLKLDKEAFKMFFEIYEKYYKISFKENINAYKSIANIVLPDYTIFNENNEIEEDETLEFLIDNLTYLTKRKYSKNKDN